MKQLKTWLPWIFGGICFIYLLFAMAFPPYPQEAIDWRQWSEIPVVYKGRIKPIDSFARNSLSIISDRQTFRDSNGKQQPAIRWLLEAMVDTQASRDYKIFRIEHDQVLDVLGLKPRQGFRYSLNEIAPHYGDFLTQAMTAYRKDPAQRDLFDRKAVELFDQLDLYRQILEQQVPLLLAPVKDGDDWTFLGKGQQEFALLYQAQNWMKMFDAYKKNNPESFNQSAQQQLSYLREKHPQIFTRVNMERVFNYFQPYYKSLVLYLIVFLIIVFSWMFWEEPLQSTGLSIAAIAFFIHTFALFLRMYIQQRPPVTNLYSSAIFVGWCAVLLGLCVEWFMRNGFGTMMAAISGFLTLIIAHNLGGDGDTMEMMRAVLDTNFWLATHVTTVTIGYSATFLAGFMAIVLIIRGVFTKSLSSEQFNKISQMIYGIIAFATIFSFIGTVLGGIWADQSWGRFWGWDPKENGALMIVLWNALILHARWGGIARKRGVALLAVFGNIITAWSWFGVNMLGVGLHSYGFTDAAVVGLLGFVGLQLLVIFIGLTPQENWRSFAPVKRGESSF